jgi:hypothetical protein
MEKNTEPRPAEWYRDFEKHAEAGRPGKEHEEEDHRKLGGWRVEISWFEEQIAKIRASGQEDLHFIFVVTKGMNDDYTEDMIIDPANHRLWISGIENPRSFAEDIPPVEWP